MALTWWNLRRFASDNKIETAVAPGVEILLGTLIAYTDIQRSVEQYKKRQSIPGAKKNHWICGGPSVADSFEKLYILVGRAFGRSSHWLDLHSKPV